MRDRLKELDPPPMENYIDPETIERIKSQSKPPVLRKQGSNKAGGLSAKDENK